MKIVSYKVVLLFIVLAFQIACGQNNSIEAINQNSRNDTRIESAIKQVNEMNTAMSEKNYSKFADFAHPKILEIIGGKSRLIEIAKEITEKGEVLGVKTVSSEFGKPSSITEIEQEIYITIPYMQITETPKGKLQQESTFIGVSNDNGDNWKFINGINQEKFKAIFPNAAEKIQIPKEEPPISIENN